MPSDAPYRDQRSRHQDGQDPQDGRRRSHHPASRLRDQPGHPQTDRRNLRLDQDDRRIGAGQSPHACQGASRLHLRNPGLQSRANTQASGGHMRRSAKSALIGKWRSSRWGSGTTITWTWWSPPTSSSKLTGLVSSSSDAWSAASIAPSLPMLPTSPGKAPTRWTPSPEMDGPNSTMMVRSTAKSASISPTNQPSKLANGDFSAAC